MNCNERTLFTCNGVFISFYCWLILESFKNDVK